MKETLFERMGSTYRKEGDYLLPNVAASEQPTFGPFGQRHYVYIRKHDKTLFSRLWLSGELNTYIENIDRQADEMFSQLVREIAKKRKCHRTPKSHRPNGMGTPNEQYPPPRGGNSQSGIDFEMAT